MSITWGEKAATLVAVANKYKIPLPALAGIYGQETGFGLNVNTSTAGAVGHFQFIPSTAQQYGYPQTNAPTFAQFQQQADAWGRYLIANNPSRDPNGWAPAMKGGYTEAQAEGTIKTMPQSLRDALGQAIVNGSGAFSSVPGVSGPGGIAGALDSAITTPINTATSVADGIGRLADLVTSLDFWKRLGEVLAGIILVAMGLRSLTGGSVDPIEVATAAAQRVRPT